MHFECNRQKAREVGMSQQPQWDVWPSGSPDLPDSLAQEQEVALLSSAEDCGKQIQLPKQLEAVRKASEFPFERHRWNTNEEVAAILIAFDKHESWEKQEVRTRPPSGTMLLYSRKKVRYRKDGYCWKKRKDGKTTREDHMKLKVQGIECIYGSYVHSAILPTFHRRCYWLLQNPDLVLVHYLNVPLTDDNKICLPPILQVDCKDWSHDDLVSQLRPMFASVKHFETASNVNETAEDAIESLVKHILGNPVGGGGGGSSGSNPVQQLTAASSMPRTTVETLRNTSSDQKMAPSSAPNTMHNRLLQLIYSHKISPGGASSSSSVPCVVGSASGHQQMSPTQIGLTVCEPNNGTTVLRGLKSSTTLSSGHKVSPHNGPLILNVSPLPGSKGLLILSSQTATSSKGTLSVLHQAPVGGRIDVGVTSKDVADSSGGLQGDYSDLGKKAFQPVFPGLGSENVRSHCESTTGVGSKATPCYGVVSDFLNHRDILGEFDMQQVVKTEAKDGQLHGKTAGHIPDFSSGSCVAEFSRRSCVRDPGSVEESDAHDLNQIGMDSMEFLFGDSGLTDPPSSLISENDIKCEFYNFHESSSSEVGNRGNSETIGNGSASAGASCMTDTMDTSLTGHEKDLDDDIKALHGNDLMMDELEDILHIVSESLGSSVDLTNTFSLSDDPDSSAATMSGLYQCADVSGSGLLGSRGQVLSVDEKLKTCLDVVQNETHSTNDNRLFGSESGKVGLVEITDYCPEWSYPEGGTKVLVTGPWHQTSSSYSVLFDDLSVPTSMVQGGVLRCFAPAHSPAVVCLHVAYNGQVISEPKVFEYKSRDQAETGGNETDWFLVQERQLKESLVQRFVEVEKSLMEDQATTASLSTSLPLEVTESCLVGLVDRLTERPSTLHCSPPVESPTRMTLLHLSAALGFNRLLSTLIKWRNNNSCLVLEQEIDSLSLDSKGNTPLMWACARGHSEAAMVLAHWSPSSLHNSNKANWRPMTILEYFGHRSIIDLLQQISTSSGQTSFLDSLTALEQSDTFRRLLTSDEDFNGSAKQTKASDYRSLDQKPGFSQLFSGGLQSDLTDATIPLKTDFTPPCDSRKDREYWRAVDAPLQHSLCSAQVAPPAAGDVVGDSDTCPPVLFGSATKASGTLKRTRLMKRTSVDILPDYPQFYSDLPKLSRTGAHPDGDEDGDTFEGQGQMAASSEEHAFMAGLRASSSDPHLTNLERSSPLGSGSGGDPMISRIDRDLNSPVLFLQTSASFDEDKGLSLEDIQRETVAMDMDSSDNLEGLSRDDGSEMLQSASVEADDHSNQMMTLASQIIAAMPERIKISPSHSKHLLMDEINSRRDRTSSYGSFSSCSSSTPPVCITEDSGISTPLEGMSFLEYRYSDMGTPTSTLSPTSTCMQSPYSFGLDSPPPTTAEFTEYFNAPAMYMEKDFSQLTLSDEEQRRLYEAAKIIQNFYRKYKDKKEQQIRQQQKEIEAAILIQSYYRRYKQFMYYKRMTQAAVLIQSQFRSYYAQKCFRRSREAATIIQNRYRAYKEHERYKKSRNAAVIIQQRFRSHYQRTLAGRQSSLASTVHKMMADSDVSSDTTDARELGIGDTNPNQNSSEQEEIRVAANEEDVKTRETVAISSEASSDCSSCRKEIPSAKDDETSQRL